MNVLVVCKLANHTLKENVLLPLLSSECVEQIFVLRDMKDDDFSGRVSYVCQDELSDGNIRHIIKVWKGIKVVRKYKVGAIIGVLNTPHGFIGRTIGYLTHTPYIHMTIAGHREYWVDGPIVEKLNLWAFGHGAAITVTGKQTQKYLVEKGVRKDKIFILPNLPNEAFTKVETNDNRHYDIVSFSRIDLNKNIILLIKALARLKEKFQLKVVIAGDGDQLENIKNAAKEYGVSEMIDFMGYVSGFDNKVKVLSDSKIFISCSKGEGFPVSLLEAMNCGCVPVVSNVGDIVDVIQNGKNGYVFNDTDDETEFAGYLEQLLLDSNSIVAMRHEAYKIKDEISVANNGKIWDKVFAYICH
jgi:glycosyltransferase involved in cell wall biosynthesis